MFRRARESTQPHTSAATSERITSVLGENTSWLGKLDGRGGVRIEGAYEGEIDLQGMLVIGETGRVTCEDIKANYVIVAGAIKGNITAEKIEIRSTGRIWGNVVTAALSTEEGAFLRGQITMEEHVDLESKAEPEEAKEEDKPKPAKKQSKSK
jgi:cytoskeletal protein CcmA (bactofilin family)